MLVNLKCGQVAIKLWFQPPKKIKINELPFLAIKDSETPMHSQLDINEKPIMLYFACPLTYTNSLLQHGVKKK